jgi:hypothetical protein
LAAVCSLGSGTPCAAMAANIIPLAPVSPANAAAAHAPLRKVPEYCFIGRVPLFFAGDHCSAPFLIRLLIRPAADVVSNLEKHVIHLYSIFIHFIPFSFTMILA